jgi:glycosyltransferase involved in cell wall biosynthesis
VKKTRLVVIGPLPPPMHGVALSTALVLANPRLRQSFELQHLDTSDHRSGQNIGRWDAHNVFLGAKHLLELVRQLRGRRGLIYLPLSQSPAGILRDLLFIDWAILRGWRVAAHLRGGEFDNVYQTQNAAFRAWIRLSLARLDAMAVMGESLRDVFDGLVDADRISVIPNGTPDADYSLNGAGPVLFLSNLRRRKGVVEAVEAAIRVVENEPTARFQFAGAWEDSDLERELRARIRPYSANIQFEGSINGRDKEALLRDASMLLFPPTMPEGHPRVILEALAAGLPIITTNQGAIGETITHAVTGFVLPDADPIALGDHVLELLRDKELHRRMSIAARSRYLEEYTQDRADRTLADWLMSVAREQPGAECPPSNTRAERTDGGLGTNQ